MSIVPERLITPRYCQACGGNLVERYVEAEERRRFQCELCGFIHYMNPRVVASVIVENQRRVLLQQRAIEPRRGYWTFPGGFLEIGETPAEGAVREAREETGVDVTLRALQGVYTRRPQGIVLVVYDGFSESDEAVVGDFESSDVRWFGIDDIPWSELAFETTEEALRDWVAAHA